jgi:hypothetical protein
MSAGKHPSATPGGEPVPFGPVIGASPRLQSAVRIIPQRYSSSPRGGAESVIDDYLAHKPASRSLNNPSGSTGAPLPTSWAAEYDTSDPAAASAEAAA